MKLPYLKSTILSSKLAKGMGHNYYGEAAWPNDILYIFPVVIFGVASSVFGLAIIQPLGMGEPANGFATPLEILPEWYFFPIFNLLRVLSDKFVGILSNLYIPALLLVLPFGENLNRYQNPFRRPIMISIFLSTVVYSIWLGIGSLLPVVEALPFLLVKNMLESYPEGLVACVSDSFDVFRACKDYWGGELKDLIKGRITDTKFGRLVVRPDSGDPADTCCSILKILCEQFKEDVTTTSTGHKLLPPYIRVIQGDGVDWESVPKILQRLKDEGYAADNLAFGSGGALLQKLNRDTFKCAFKCSEITIEGVKRDVFKDPITDKGKASKKGRLTLQLAKDTTGFTEEDKYKPRSGDDGVAGGTGFLHYTPDGEYVTVASGKGDAGKDILVEVFRDGALMKEWTLKEIRVRADIPKGPWAGAA